MADAHPTHEQTERFKAADARVKEIIAKMPSALDIIEGRAERDETLIAELAAARAERLEAMREMHNLRGGPWGDMERPAKAPDPGR